MITPIEKYRALVEIERSLTHALDGAHPHLPPAAARRRPRHAPGPSLGLAAGLSRGPHLEPHAGGGSACVEVRPGDVPSVLAYARILASRSSAPVAWDPAAHPIVGFSPPAPLPHQMRSGVLNASELRKLRRARREAGGGVEGKGAEKKPPAPTGGGAVATAKRKPSDSAPAPGGGGQGATKGAKRVAPDPSGRGISKDDTVMTTAPAVRDIGMADLSDSDDDSDDESDSEESDETGSGSESS